MDEVSGVLDRNLKSLARTSPAAAQQVAAAAARWDLQWIETDEGLSATLGGVDSAAGATGRAVASRRRPRSAAFRLAETADVHATPCIAVLGFGLGYHVAEIARQMKKTGVVVVFEPDAGLLRAVFERMDCTSWLDEANVVLVTDPHDRAALGEAFRGAEALIASGVQIVRHPPSQARLDREADAFGRTLTAVLKAVKLQVVTTLMQSEVTLRNVTQNLDHYAGGAGVLELRGAAAGRTAVTVAAGPSLARNIDRLSELGSAGSGLRDRVVLIAAQPVLKPLLERGVRPHFVTAIDYHEISQRFYEGLTPEDVEGVTLVASPRCNPAILQAYPGAIRLLRDEWLDSLLGAELARPMGELPPAATVAHLSYALARYLGCDPVALVGQDLGFTDGHYYAAGAAIHGVWAGELNGFQTLETLEWQRIARMKPILAKTEDVFGKPIYTDEQMHAYLQQFEEDFARDVAAGRTILDATEGGVAKRGASPTTLDAVLRSAADQAPFELPTSTHQRDTARVDAARERLVQAADSSRRVAEVSRETGALLEEMREQHQDQEHVNRLIARVDTLRDEVVQLRPAYGLAHHLNQTGTLKRVLADRAIDLDDFMEPLERQQKQIERDAVNVSWLGESAANVERLLRDAARTIGTDEKTTRAPSVGSEDVDLDTDAAQTAADALSDAGGRGVRGSSGSLTVLMPFDPTRTSLGSRSPAGAEPIASGLNPLQLTLERLARAQRVARVVVLTSDVAAAKAVLRANEHDDIEGLDVQVRAWPVEPSAERARAISAARLLAPACWRGAPGNATIFDELLDPRAVLAAMEALEVESACLVGDDWMMIDPALVDACIDRHLEQPERRAIVFTQSAPGLAPLVVGASFVRELTEATSFNYFASVGGMTGYVPVAPMTDPIVKSACVGVSPEVRDAQLRLTASTPERRAMLMEACTAIGPGWLDAPAETLIKAARGAIVRRMGEAPRELAIELCPGRLTSGPRGAWMRDNGEPAERVAMSASLATRLVESFGRIRSDGVLHLGPVAHGLGNKAGGAGDPLLHSAWADITRAAKAVGVACVHVRTDLIAPDGDVDRLAQEILDSGVDVLSVDLLAETPETYRALTGTDHFDLVRRTLGRLLELRAERLPDATLPTPWIVPRITRCEAVYAEIEPFYDRWLMLAGACVIDALPAESGDRYEPLPVPASAAARMSAELMRVASDGTAEGCSVPELGLAGAWREITRLRGRGVRSERTVAA